MIPYGSIGPGSRTIRFDMRVNTELSLPGVLPKKLGA